MGDKLFNWHCELFEKDISKYTYIELAEWILKCRHVVSKSAFNEIGDYLNSVYAFCHEWEEHYQQNEKIYKSNKFKKAILFIGRKDKYKFVVDYGKGKEDVTDIVYSNMQSSIFKKKVDEIAFETLNDDIFECDEVFKSCFKDKKSFKNKLNDLICDFYFYKYNSRIRVFTDDKWFKAATYKDFLNECEKNGNYTIKLENKESYGSYLKVLDSYGISKTIYLDYMSVDKAEKAFDKKIFINLAFALSLPLRYAEDLLYYNGFSIIDSVKVLDIICEKAFRIGFGRDYVIALIDKYNADMRKNFPNFVEVQNITKSKR